MDQYIGRLLDNRYEILEIIGTGGMAVVYKARCHRLNRLVAIKILKDEFARDEEFRRRFRAEGEAVAMLGNPNIVQVYDVSSSESANYIVMELIEGITLKQYLEKRGSLNWKETLHFAMQIAKALEHAHSRGIVHRDIKPHNVMVLKNGSVKVTDFGIARVMSKSNTLTKEALGSVHYISPEQAKGGWVDNRSDLYSLSVVMYEMMTGRPPYDGESPVAVAIQHINGGAAMPSSLNPNIPAGLEQIIMKGMALDVKDRYSSAAEMLRDMDEFRKDPAILFAAPTPKVSDATQHVDLSGIARQNRSMAEKTAQRKSGESGRLRNTGTGAAAAAGAGAVRRSSTGKNSTGRSSGSVSRNTSASSQRSRREREEEERRSHFTTLAIVTIMNGGFGSQQPDLVSVPGLVGKVYESLPHYENFVISLGVPRYDDTVPKGQIIEQNPPEGSNVVKGSEISVVVSLGAEPTVKVMEDILGTTQEVAETFLTGQGFATLVWEEPSDEYAAGTVCRTDPAVGEELEEGQVIRLYISSGPTITELKMPNVVGMNYATAYQYLTNMGFVYVEPRQVPSNETKDEVVRQSFAKDTMVDVTETIILYISEGPEETEEPTTEPTEETTEPSEPTEETTEPTEETDSTEETEPSTAPSEETEPSEPVQDQKKTCTFILPEREGACTYTLYCDGQIINQGGTLMPEQSSISFSLTGSGERTYVLHLHFGGDKEDQEIKQTVNFDE